MTAILVGRAPQGNLIVSDAMVSDKDKVKSYKECELRDKISSIWSAKCYCSLVGDANVLQGISYLDFWYQDRNVKIDFSRKEIMNYALIAAEKYRELRSQEGCERKLNDDATVYFVNQEQVFEYEIILSNDKYHIENFRFFSDNEVLINYDFHIEPITGFNHPNDQLFEKAKECIESVHKKWKEISEFEHEQYCLDYDFDDRFCGVVYSKKQDEKKRFYSPFNNLSELIAADASTPKMTWELIEDKKFRWSPEDIYKPPKRK